MAHLEISVTRDNGVTNTAQGSVPDDYVLDMAGTLAAMLFEASLAPAES